MQAAARHARPAEAPCSFTSAPHFFPAPCIGTWGPLPARNASAVQRPPIAVPCGTLPRRRHRGVCRNRIKDLELDLLPGGVPNTLFRRLLYWTGACYSLPELLQLCARHAHKGGEFDARHAAAALMRVPTLLYHRWVPLGRRNMQQNGLLQAVRCSA